LILSPICTETPHGRIGTKFGNIGVVDAIAYDKYFADRLRGINSVGIQNLPLPLTRPVAVKIPRSP